MATQSTPTPEIGFPIPVDDAVDLVMSFTAPQHKQFPELNVAPAQLNLRLCTVCSEAIPAARLKAKPGATKCVPCLTAAGDVPLLRRFDEQSAQGTVETLFTSDVNLSRQLDRQRQTVPGYREALEYVAETEQ